MCEDFGCDDLFIVSIEERLVDDVDFVVIDGMMQLVFDEDVLKVGFVYLWCEEFEVVVFLLFCVVYVSIGMLQ